MTHSVIQVKMEMQDLALNTVPQHTVLGYTIAQECIGA